jgi:hypothetical protein
MSANHYQFITTWRVQASLEEINAIIGNAPDLVRWWPSVYLDVRELASGDSRGLGKVVSLYTKGWLPYTLRWQFGVSDVNYPHGFTLTAWGDFVGCGIWTFEPDDDHVIIQYDWKISAEKPLLKYFSLIMKPIFSANHHWAMARGEESLKLELARRHARTPEQRAAVPPPPAATFGFMLPENARADQVLSLQ